MSDILLNQVDFAACRYFIKIIFLVDENSPAVNL